MTGHTHPTMSEVEKEAANHSSTPACKTPWTGEPGRLQSTASQRAGTAEPLSMHVHGMFEERA